jgi:sugar O-acyltransferase (sialic acid O-acetyltransferase NeuD family)
VVIGGGGHAKVLLHILERLPAFEVLGYLDPDDRGILLGHPRLGGDEFLPKLARKHPSLAAAIGIGKVKAESRRLKLIADLLKAGLALPPIIAPSAVVARDVVIGDGSVIFDGAVVQPGCQLGKGVIVNSRAVVDHDCSLGADVHLAPGAVLSGGVVVGDSCFLGAGSVCKQGVKIAEGCTIGAGAAVVSDCLEAGTFVGVPARRIEK